MSSSQRAASRALIACAAAALFPFAQLGACTRHADIRDEPDASGPLNPEPQPDAGNIPELDSGLGTDAYPACGDRPRGDCEGSVDFPCGFTDWVNRTAASCQRATGCRTDGWLEVQMGPDGCVLAIGMDRPNDEIIACLVAELGAVSCACGEGQSRYFFGYGNAGFCPIEKPPG